jgi:adenylate cyclase
LASRKIAGYKHVAPTALKHSPHVAVLNRHSIPMSAPRRHSRTPLIAICTLCTLIVGAIYHFESKGLVIFRHELKRMVPLEAGELRLQDFMMRMSLARRAAPRPDLVYLAIDSPSIQLDVDDAEIAASPALRLMKESGWPWSRAVYPMIIERLTRAGAKVVALDLLFPTPREGDNAFREALDKYRAQVVMGSNFAESDREHGVALKSHDVPAKTLIPPASPVDDRVGFINHWPDTDDVIRRVWYRTTVSQANGRPAYPGEEVIDSFTARIVRKTGRADLIPGPEGPRRIRFAGENVFSAHPVCDIFLERMWERPPYNRGEFFRDKIVVVGPHGNFLKDFVLTSFKYMNGPEMHLNALNALLNQDFIRETSGTTNCLLIAAGGFLAWALSIVFASPFVRLAMLVAAALAWLAIGLALFNFAGILIVALSPLVTLGSSGVGCLAWDFIIEQREKTRARRTLERHVGKDAAREILDNPSGFYDTLGGVRKPVAILFSDLRGFTAMTERADSHALVSQLNEYFTAMIEPLTVNQGALDKFIGDAIMAVWGNIRTRGAAEDVRGAVTTALRMREALAALNARWRAEGRTPFGMGIAVNFGEVIVGNIGSMRQMSLTVIGDAVNLTSRLEGVTKEYGVDLLIGEEAAALAREFFHLQTAGLVQVKGREKPVEIFTVLGELERPLDATKAEYLRLYEQAMSLYRQRDFAAAAELFQRSLQLVPDDSLAAIYVERCAALQQERPPEDWNGVYVMKEK